MPISALVHLHDLGKVRLVHHIQQEQRHVARGELRAHFGRQPQPLVLIVCAEALPQPPDRLTSTLLARHLSRSSRPMAATRGFSERL
jgi:hypothetical protein